jgi:hypothetical protein
VAEVKGAPKTPCTVVSKFHVVVLALCVELGDSMVVHIQERVGLLEAQLQGERSQGASHLLFTNSCIYLLKPLLGH